MRPIIVAEIGINHDGDFKRLVKLSELALQNGADYVKVQVRTPELCVPEHVWDKPKIFRSEQMTYLEYRELMEFSESEWAEYDYLLSVVHGPALWFPSVWDYQSLRRVSRFNLPFIKIPSALIVNNRLIDQVATFANSADIPVVASTGMSTTREIDRLINTLLSRCKHRPYILHCNSSYPANDSEADLAAIFDLRRTYPQVHVGFSSHHVSPFVPIHSFGFGAEMVEVHFTDDRSNTTTGDHSASQEPNGLALIAREAARFERVKGKEVYGIVYESEMGAKSKLRGDE